MALLPPRHRRRQSTSHLKRCQRWARDGPGPPLASLRRRQALDSSSGCATLLKIVVAAARPDQFVPRPQESQTPPWWRSRVLRTCSEDSGRCAIPANATKNQQRALVPSGTFSPAHRCDTQTNRDSSGRRCCSFRNGTRCKGRNICRFYRLGRNKLKGGFHGYRSQLLSKPYERGTYEATMARFVEFQTAIEAVERALLSEADYP
jgi:hypothetical protein